MRDFETRGCLCIGIGAGFLLVGIKFIVAVW